MPCRLATRYAPSGDDVRRRASPPSISNHSFRATGITVHQQNGDRLEDTQELAGHADARTTRLDIRKARKRKSSGCNCEHD
jgi:integrase